MFGHQDDETESQDNQKNTVVEETQTLPNEGGEQEQTQPDEQPAEPAEQADAPVADDSSDGPQDTDVPSSDDAPAGDVDELVITPGDDDKDADDADKPDETAGGDDWQHPGTPLEDDKEKIRDVISPAGGFPKHPGFQYPASSGSNSEPGDSANEELDGIRKQALDELSPLVDKLDLPAEDKFRTLMMVIQANDNQELVKAAYEAAHSIEDEKVRAQALYDIVNEINYFTAPPQDQTVSD